MNDRLRRRLTVLLTILVAVTILSMVGVPSLPSGSPALIASFGLHPSLGWETVFLIVSIWIVLIAMLALIPLRLLVLRPPGRRLWRQPGWLACNAVALSLAIGLVRPFLTIGVILARRSPPFSFN